MTASIAAPALWLDPSGSGASRWQDCAPGRIDLPRRLPDMPVLGITALGVEAARPDGDGFLYRRTPRPGQGRLTGRPTTGLVIVLISPKHAEAAQTLRDWGDFVHLSEIVAASVDGYTMITPYEVDGDGPRFLHLYELESDDPEATFQAMTPRVRARLDDAAYECWAFHPELRIDFVSTYRRLT